MNQNLLTDDKSQQKKGVTNSKPRKNKKNKAKRTKGKRKEQNKKSK